MPRHYNDDYDAEPWQNNVNLEEHNRAVGAQMRRTFCKMFGHWWVPVESVAPELNRHWWYEFSKCARCGAEGPKL